MRPGKDFPLLRGHVTCFSAISLPAPAVRAGRRTMTGLTRNSACWATACLDTKGVRGFLLEETLQCGCGHWTCPTLLLSNGPYFENKTGKDQCITCNCFSASAKSVSLLWCSVFQKCLLYSKLSLERHDNSFYVFWPCILVIFDFMFQLNAPLVY